MMEGNKDCDYLLSFGTWVISIFFFFMSFLKFSEPRQHCYLYPNHYNKVFRKPNGADSPGLVSRRGHGQQGPKVKGSEACCPCLQLSGPDSASPCLSVTRNLLPLATRKGQWGPVSTFPYFKSDLLFFWIGPVFLLRLPARCSKNTVIKPGSVSCGSLEPGWGREAGGGPSLLLRALPSARGPALAPGPV